MSDNRNGLKISENIIGGKILEHITGWKLSEHKNRLEDLIEFLLK